MSSADNSPNLSTNNEDQILHSPIQLAIDQTERKASPDWNIDTNSFFARLAVEGAYLKMLSAFESWKADPTIMACIAAFMDYGTDLKALLGNFGKHLIYHKTRDTPLQIVFFGEIVPMTFGTSLGAKGNHYIGTAGNVSSSFSNQETSSVSFSVTQSLTTPRYGTS